MTIEQPQTQKRSYIKVCKMCGKSFKANTANAVCCFNPKCKQDQIRLHEQSRKFRRKAKLADDPELKNKYLELAKSTSIIKETHKCVECSSEFIPIKGTSKYCSKECRQKANSRMRLKKYNAKKKIKKEDSNKLEANTKSISELMREYEELKSRRIDPFYLSRGKPSNGLGTALTDGY